MVVNCFRFRFRFRFHFRFRFRFRFRLSLRLSRFDYSRLSHSRRHRVLACRTVSNRSQSTQDRNYEPAPAACSPFHSEHFGTVPDLKGKLKREPETNLPIDERVSVLGKLGKKLANELIRIHRALQEIRSI